MMNDIPVENKEEAAISKTTRKLMAYGTICPQGGCPLTNEVRRGMPIHSKEGQEVGKVAAVVIDGKNNRATGLLLGRLPEVSGYWRIPLDLIAGVRLGFVELTISAAEVASLPRWHAAWPRLEE